ncbi:MAG: putative porin [Bacteroidales bacterium]|nr:putative porin [Bacteroidales bacterium]
MIRHISIILLFAFSSGLNAQKQDTLKPRILKQWNLSSDFSEEVIIPFDTVFSLFNRFRIADKYSSVNATLGNYGLPFYQISFFDRITDPDKFLYNSYYPFMHVPDNAVFMNTQVPFTELIWTFAGPRETSEQTFRVRHSQNVNRFLNFGLTYDIIYNLGQYNYQRAEDKSFTLYSSYTGVKYKLYFAAGMNNLISYENGGITDKSQLNMSDTREVPVNLGGLDKANTRLKNRNLLLVQRYTLNGNPEGKSDSVSQKRSGFFGLSGTFSHIFILESNKRTYSDGYPASGFYDSTFISKTVTFDSLYSRNIKNTVRFDFTTDETRKFRLGGGVGLRNEIFRYSQIMPTHDTMFADTVVWNRSNNVLVGRLYNNIGDKFRWIATGELFLSGYRAGDFNLNGEISKSFDWKKGRASWLITGGIANRQPSFWYDRWGSNHFEWNNNFKKELRIDLGSVFSYPARKAEIKFNYAIIDNYTDFDTTALPSQHSGGLSVAALTVRKELRAWKFHLSTDVIIQKSSNADVLDLPLVTVRSAGYFEHLFRFKQTGGRMNTQLGVDVTYHTLYHPYSYMPATGRFFRQDQASAGNYPFLNVFLNFKVKRTRVFIMFDHVNYGMMGNRIGNNYDMIPNYPMNIRMFRYGLAWTFYD